MARTIPKRWLDTVLVPSITDTIGRLQAVHTKIQQFDSDTTIPKEHTWPEKARFFTHHSGRAMAHGDAIKDICSRLSTGYPDEGNPMPATDPGFIYLHNMCKEFQRETEMYARKVNLLGRLSDQDQPPLDRDALVSFVNSSRDPIWNLKEITQGKSWERIELDARAIKAAISTVQNPLELWAAGRPILHGNLTHVREGGNAVARKSVDLANFARAQIHGPSTLGAGGRDPLEEAHLEARDLRERAATFKAVIEQCVKACGDQWAFDSAPMFQEVYEMTLDSIFLMEVTKAMMMAEGRNAEEIEAAERVRNDRQSSGDSEVEIEMYP